MTTPCRLSRFLGHKPRRDSAREPPLLEEAEIGGFTVTCPALPEVVTEGDTLEQALAMASDAIQLALQERVQDGRPIPQDRDVEPLPVGPEGSGRGTRMSRTGR